MRVLVAFAVEAEFAPWRKRHRFVPVKSARLSFWRAQLGEAEVTVLLTGMGPRRAATSMAEISMLHAAKDHWMDCCISAGLTGALRPHNHPADILVARRTACGEFHHGLRDSTIQSDAELLALARDNGAALADKFLTVDHIVVTAREKAELGTKADAVDMESFEVLREGAAWGARGVAIRAVSDSADEDLPIDFNRVLTPDGRVSVPGILCELRGDPGRFPALVRFGGKSRQAARALAGFLDRFIPAISASDLSRQTAPEEASAT